MDHKRPALSDQVTDNPARRRYELALDGGTAFVSYALSDDVITLLHAEVPRALRGQGIGAELVSGVLKDVRRRGLKPLPLCPFVASEMAAKGAR